MAKLLGVVGGVRVVGGGTVEESRHYDTTCGRRRAKRGAAPRREVFAAKGDLYDNIIHELDTGRLCIRTLPTQQTPLNTK